MVVTFVIGQNFSVIVPIVDFMRARPIFVRSESMRAPSNRINEPGLILISVMKNIGLCHAQIVLQSFRHGKILEIVVLSLDAWSILVDQVPFRLVLLILTLWID